MPALGADMDEGTLVEWLVKPGDEIRKGELIAVVDTAKSAIEVESFHTGTVEQLVIPVGETVPVGTVLATIVEPGAAAAPAAAGAPAAAVTAREMPAAGERAAAAPVAPAAKPARAAAKAKRARAGAKAKRAEAKAGRAPAAAEAAPGVRAAPPGPAEPARAAVLGGITPLVRREAGELGVDLARVHGTGRGGAITRADVERAAGAAARAAAPGAAAAAAPAARAGAAGAARARVTPLARRVAAELGVDLAAVTGTGAQGAIRERDVQQAARAGPAAAAAAGEAPAGAAAAAEAAAGEKPAGRAGATKAERTLAMRQAIARLMARSKREIPHYYVSNTVDMAAAMTWLRERNLELDMSERLVPAALLLKAAALAARQIPQVNGYWVDDHFDPAGHVHLGTAISLRGGGLITPAIHDADQLTLRELMAGLRDLVTRARAGRLRRAELTDATITVTNLGDQGVESVYGVIYPPQVALIGFGKVAERPWASGGMLGVRPVVRTTLAADHRATDGYTGARYLAAIADLLQQPEEL